MACPSPGPCDWGELELCCLGPSGLTDPCLTDGTPVDQSIIDSSTQAAKEVVWALTGRQFGQCIVKLRPCRKSCNPCPDIIDWTGPGGFGVGPNGYGPALIDGQWFNISCSFCTECSCTHLCEIQLPYPTCCVDELKVDGIIIDPSNYRIDDFNRLVGLGDFCFPFCQDLTKEDTEEGTWSVTISYGRPVPQLALLAAAELACQLIKQCVGQPCQLPARMTSITRQGVTVGFLDPMDFLNNGRTGIYLIDLAISTFNPHKLTRRPTVWSPDAGPNWRVTTSGPGETCP